MSSLRLYRIRISLEGREITSVYATGCTKKDAFATAKFRHSVLLSSDKFTFTTTPATEAEEEAFALLCPYGLSLTFS
jgi:hypothetical protein